ncbi:hypothetical protein AU255_09185 [Methyloprofundus sedimenti]|uniref:Uncharacterized protein n=1 Tax=Methyloprofundus sedimenti TaxID=1420851 RepID=A0A1V8M8V2_9GAMM|nr:hypothetical protein [Methyloprofundus sedimenti]OQK18011.1 hypothetical protein AU255_09185 [Methyloprofundus sedimenti]
MGVIDQMADVGLTGLAKQNLIVDGLLHRFRPDWEPKAAKKRAWYILFPFKTDSGADLIAGSFGWFKGADSYAFNVSLKSAMSPLSIENHPEQNVTIAQGLDCGSDP